MDSCLREDREDWAQFLAVAPQAPFLEQGFVPTNCVVLCYDVVRCTGSWALWHHARHCNLIHVRV